VTFGALRKCTGTFIKLGLRCHHLTFALIKGLGKTALSWGTGHYTAAWAMALIGPLPETKALKIQSQAFKAYFARPLAIGIARCLLTQWPARRRAIVQRVATTVEHLAIQYKHRSGEDPRTRFLWNAEIWFIKTFSPFRSKRRTPLPPNNLPTALALPLASRLDQGSDKISKKFKTATNITHRPLEPKTERKIFLDLKKDHLPSNRGPFLFHNSL